MQGYQDGRLFHVSRSGHVSEEGYPGHRSGSNRLQWSLCAEYRVRLRLSGRRRSGLPVDLRGSFHPERRSEATSDRTVHLVRIAARYCRRGSNAAGDGCMTLVLGFPISFRGIVHPGRRSGPASDRESRAWSTRFPPTVLDAVGDNCMTCRFGFPVGFRGRFHPGRRPRPMVDRTPCTRSTALFPQWL